MVAWETRRFTHTAIPYMHITGSFRCPCCFPAVPAEANHRPVDHFHKLTRCYVFTRKVQAPAHRLASSSVISITNKRVTSHALARFILAEYLPLIDSEFRDGRRPFGSTSFTRSFKNRSQLEPALASVAGILSYLNLRT